jgi:Mrp family chromosome partitioning ATPase
MARILLVAQEKGGVGKSLVARGVAEAATGTAILEIDSTQRLLELEDRVQFFSMRVERDEIERTGGRAARAEFDPVINAIASADRATLVDVGANTSRALLSVLRDVKQDLAESNVEFGILVVVTAEPGAISEAPRILELGRELGATLFVVENQIHGTIPKVNLKKIIGDATLTSLREHAMEAQAVTILQGTGLAAIPRLDAAKLNQAHGLALGSRIRRDLTALRADTMEAVRPAAEWLVSGK